MDTEVAGMLAVMLAFDTGVGLTIAGLVTGSQILLYVGIILVAAMIMITIGALGGEGNVLATIVLTLIGLPLYSVVIPPMLLLGTITEGIEDFTKRRKLHKEPSLDQIDRKK